MLTANKSEMKCVIPSFIFVLSGVTCHICTHLSDFSHQLSNYVTLQCLCSNEIKSPTMHCEIRKLTKNFQFKLFVTS